MDGFVAGDDFDDGASGRFVGRRDEEDAIEATGAAESGIEMPRGVGGPEDEKAVVVADIAVHFGEKLVDESSASGSFVVIAVGGEGVDFVEENDRWSVAANEFEKGVEIFFGVSEIEVEDLVDSDGEKVRLNFSRSGTTD